MAAPDALPPHIERSKPNQCAKTMKAPPATVKNVLSKDDISAYKGIINNGDADNGRCQQCGADNGCRQRGASPLMGRGMIVSRTIAFPTMIFFIGIVTKEN